MSRDVKEFQYSKPGSVWKQCRESQLQKGDSFFIVFMNHLKVDPLLVTIEGYKNDDNTVVMMGNNTKLFDSNADDLNILNNPE